MTSFTKRILGYWQKPETVNRMPDLRRDFDQNRDPMIASQLQDNDKTEAQRRREQTRHAEPQASNNKPGRDSKMVQQDHPHPAPHPTGPIADAVDQTAFRDRWLAEQRDAAFEQAVERQPVNDLSQEMARAATPSHGPER